MIVFHPKMHLKHSFHFIFRLFLNSCNVMCICSDLEDKYLAPSLYLISLQLCVCEFVQLEEMKPIY